MKVIKCSPYPLPGGQQKQGHGLVLFDQGEGCQQSTYLINRNSYYTTILSLRNSEVPKVANEVSKVQILNWNIVFNETDKLSLGHLELSSELQSRNSEGVDHLINPKLFVLTIGN